MWAGVAGLDLSLSLRASEARGLSFSTDAISGDSAAGSSPSAPKALLRTPSSVPIELRGLARAAPSAVPRRTPQDTRRAFIAELGVITCLTAERGVDCGGAGGGAGMMRHTDSSGISSSSDQRTLAVRALVGCLLLSPVNPTRNAAGRLRAGLRTAAAAGPRAESRALEGLLLALGDIEWGARQLVVSAVVMIASSASLLTSYYDVACNYLYIREYSKYVYVL